MWDCLDFHHYSYLSNEARLPYTERSKRIVVTTPHTPTIYIKNNPITYAYQTHIKNTTMGISVTHHIDILDKSIKNDELEIFFTTQEKLVVIWGQVLM